MQEITWLAEWLSDSKIIALLHALKLQRTVSKHNYSVPSWYCHCQSWSSGQWRHVDLNVDTNVLEFRGREWVGDIHPFLSSPCLHRCVVGLYRLFNVLEEHTVSIFRAKGWSSCFYETLVSAYTSHMTLLPRRQTPTWPLFEPRISLSNTVFSLFLKLNFPPPQETFYTLKGLIEVRCGMYWICGRSHVAIGLGINAFLARFHCLFRKHLKSRINRRTV
jgi:hypothetical protein